MNKFCVEVPENLDIDKVIALNPHAFYGKNKLKPDTLLYVCGAIIKARKRQHKEMEDNETNYAQVSSRKLRSVVHNYSAYIDYLWEEGIISCDFHYVPGEKCYGYCFNPPFTGQKLRTIEIKDFSLRKSIRKAAMEQQRRRKKIQKQVPYLTKWWDHSGLEIDREAALAWIEEHQQQKINAILNFEGQADQQFEIDRCIDTCELYRSHVASIDAGHFSYGFSGRGRRFYNPICNLKKELRTFLSYNGLPLVELDKKNSQPYLSLALLRATFWQSKKAQDGVLSLAHIFKKSVIKPLKKEGKGSTQEIFFPVGIIRLLKSWEDQAQQGFGGFEKYIEFVTGDFYQLIEDLFKHKHPDRFGSRKEVKKEILRILYMNPADDWKPFYEPALTFRSHFPAVYALFSKIKEKDYTDLAIILQRIESYLFLEVICKRIGASFPEIPLFTIHDCILTTEGNEDIVRQIMQEELQQWIGYPATLTCEVLTSMQAQ
ncbi:hypothetical protein [Pseudocnuella soli]|uniref:hypothetical protein n=1 Tax=Pseudocnuella soli TaxID=2502779 RepID=UPI00104B0B19|nr:hypothetical protein [Pseudocnuella soli]